MSERQGIEIDYCPQCRGVWLDRGELDKLVERSSTRHEGWDERQSSDEGRARHDSNREQGKHKKKSFWSEIFDFD
jgi:Zn-finger nucleic acid-binding protein